MTVKEIRDSGILEYHVLGLLSEDEIRQVEGYLEQFPELKQDYLEIQQVTHAYAESQSISPNPNLEERILEGISKGTTKSAGRKNSSTPTKSDNQSNIWKWLSMFLFMLTILGFWYLSQLRQDLNSLQQRFDSLQRTCDSVQQNNDTRFALYENLRHAANRPLAMTATDGFQETQLVFHTNTTTQQNFVQIINLPAIASNEAFQLWSLKDGVAPIPLNVFRGDDDAIIGVDFEPGTGTYAITIEPEGGSQTPNLAKLIGTVGVS